MAKITTSDIALAAGVSQSTVSFVLNNRASASISQATRDRVLKKAEELGYRFKKRGPLNNGKSITVGLLVPTMSNIYYPFLLHNIELYACEKDISCVIINTLRKEQIHDLYQLMRRQPIDGLLCLYAPQQKLPEDIPAVIVGEKDAGQTVDTVSLNSVTAGQIMANHLANQGHSRIAFLTSPLNKITQARRNRLEGVRRALSERKMEKNLRIIVDKAEVEALDIAYEYSLGRRMADELVAGRENISAIIAVNDMTAIGVISLLNEKGIRVPEDIAVAGFDNILFSTVVQPNLTTVDQMAFHASKLALDILLEKLRGSNQDGRIINVEYQPHLIVRESTQKH
jgi:LacI family transcriptional regulator